MVVHWPYILLLSSAVILARQDFRTREVSVLWLAMMGCGAIAATILEKGVEVMMLQFAVNFVLLLLLSGVMMCYLFLRKLTIRETFGAGDWVLLFALTPLFAPSEYLCFMLTGCVCAMLWWVVRRSEQIPFAGTLSLVIILYVGVKSVVLWM